MIYWFYKNLRAKKWGDMRKGKSRVKNRNDKRYIKVQAAIDAVLEKFIRHGHVAGMNITEVSKEANIFKSTFYDHHASLDEAISHLDTQARSDLKQILRETEETKCSLEMLYYKIVYFICKNKEYYIGMVKNGNIRPILIVTTVIKPLVVKNWRFKRQDKIDERYRVVEWKICGIIWYWGVNDNFSENNARKVVAEMVRASK